MARSKVKGTKGKPVKKASNRSGLKVAYDLPHQTEFVGDLKAQQRLVDESKDQVRRQKIRQTKAAKYNKNKWPWQKKKYGGDFIGK